MALGDDLKIDYTIEEELRLTTIASY